MRYYTFLIIPILLFSCTRQKSDSTIPNKVTTKTFKQSITVDCNYTFEEATRGTRAPEEIIAQLKLINVKYYSTDRKIHQGQILTNTKIADKIEILFHYMFYHKFPIAHAIPIVKYNWNDDLSMQANNTYSFCYRDEGFSKHATGMAIDINPYFNPVRWKAGYETRINKPVGAHHDTSIPGTFYSFHPVVQEFRKLGFHWGHNFSAKYDDHHFDM
ncbi:MAG: M15 family metallopeptidase [Paludibacter sp.]|nr:M15 family metallopeptidase [Paludibacter sp.]